VSHVTSVSNRIYLACSVELIAVASTNPIETLLVLFHTTSPIRSTSTSAPVARLFIFDFAFYFATRHCVSRKHSFLPSVQQRLADLTVLQQLSKRMSL
jgi:hypothetical protein